MAYKKSRTFAVLISEYGGLQQWAFLWLQTDVATGAKILTVNKAGVSIDMGSLGVSDTINLLVQAGLTTRHFDREESQWMDTSLSVGTIRVSGSRDGQWAEPTAEEFEEFYLKVM